MNSFDACPTIDPVPPGPEPSGSSNPLWQFLDLTYNWVLWGFVLIISGFIVAMCGRIVLRVAVFIVTTIGIGLFMSMIFFKIFLQQEHESYVDWIVLGSCILLSGIAGILLSKTEQMGLLVLGASSGFIIGLLITEAFDVSNQAAFWCTCVSLSIIFDMVSMYCLRKKRTSTRVSLDTSTSSNW